MGRVFVCVMMVALGGCSLVLGEDDTGLPLLGQPVDLSTAPKLNQAVVDSTRLMIGADAKNWVAIQEFGSVLRLRRADDPAVMVSYSAKDIHVYQKAYFLIDPDPQYIQADAEGDGGGLIVVGRPGEPTPGRQYRVPARRALLIPGGAGSVFLYLVEGADTTSFRVIRTDGSHERVLPLPDGVDPQDPLHGGMMFFDGPGDHLFVRDGAGQVMVYSTLDDSGEPLGARPPVVRVDDARKSLLFCGSDGFRRVSFDGLDERLLDSQPCITSTVVLTSAAAYLEWAGAVRRVPLDGDSAPSMVYKGPAQQILDVLPDGELIVSHDPPDRYINGASDGWIGDYQFMERGVALSVSSDNQRVRFLEHAAQASAIGDLMSFRLPDGAPVLLARNVQRYEELPDGRVLALSNAAFPGPQNRLITIDERAGKAYRVAEGVNGYTRIPNSNQILVNVLAGPDGFDVFRITIPDPPPAQNLE